MAFPATPALATDCVVYDPAGRVLLIKRKNEPFKGEYALPGGFVEIGETVDDACRRELREETGIPDAEIGACIWEGDLILDWKGAQIRMRERFYIARTGRTAVTFDNLLPHERGVYREHRWWTLAELAESDEVFIPPQLHVLAAEVLAGGIPAEPQRVELSTGFGGMARC